MEQIFSPIVPPIIVGVTVGAIVALITHRFARAREDERWNREDEQRRAELEGLLRLISMEIALHKALVLGTYSPTDSEDDRLLKIDVWEQVRPRAAQLLPAHRFASLAEYYATAQQFNDLLDKHTFSGTTKRLLRAMANNLANDLGPEIRKWMREDYIGPMSIDPDRGVSDNNH